MSRWFMYVQYILYLHTCIPKVNTKLNISACTCTFNSEILYTCTVRKVKIIIHYMYMYVCICLLLEYVCNKF